MNSATPSELETTLNKKWKWLKEKSRKWESQDKKEGKENRRRKKSQNELRGVMFICFPVFANIILRQKVMVESICSDIIYLMNKFNSNKELLWAMICARMRVPLVLAQVQLNRAN